MSENQAPRRVLVAAVIALLLLLVLVGLGTTRAEEGLQIVPTRTPTRGVVPQSYLPWVVVDRLTPVPTHTPAATPTSEWKGKPTPTPKPKPPVSCGLISETEHCLRPQDVMTTECVYDGANDTYLCYKPSSTLCTPLYLPGDVGVLYTRRQWTSACYGCSGGYN